MEKEKVSKALDNTKKWLLSSEEKAHHCKIATCLREHINSFALERKINPENNCIPLTFF